MTECRKVLVTDGVQCRQCQVWAEAKAGNDVMHLSYWVINKHSLPSGDFTVCVSNPDMTWSWSWKNGPVTFLYTKVT